MKFTKLMTVTGLALLLAVTGVGATQVSAADEGTNNKNATTTAEFSVNDGTLDLIQAPDLDFGSINTKDIVTGNTELTLKDNSTEDHVGDEENSSTDGTIAVSNYKLAANGWNLTAKASNFVNSKDNTKTIDGAIITLALQKPTTKTINSEKGTVVADAADAATDGANISISGNDAVVLSGHPALGYTTDALSNEKTILDLSGVKETSTLAEGSYISTVTWTLAEGAKPVAAK